MDIWQKFRQPSLREELCSLVSEHLDSYLWRGPVFLAVVGKGVVGSCNP